ncbi:MAG: ATP-binding cassette, subfamily C, bacterial [Rhodobacteraceae bacterium HLUCCA09]|nr:MAG: ATP-binding cassette, subfamily C, bacterial [Rhodobacteraceae bacterium HLUCCA09]
MRDLRDDEATDGAVRAESDWQGNDSSPAARRDWRGLDGRDLFSRRAWEPPRLGAHRRWSEDAATAQGARASAAARRTAAEAGAAGAAARTAAERAAARLRGRDAADRRQADPPNRVEPDPTVAPAATAPAAEASPGALAGDARKRPGAAGETEIEPDSGGATEPPAAQAGPALQAARVTRHAAALPRPTPVQADTLRARERQTETAPPTEARAETRAAPAATIPCRPPEAPQTGALGSEPKSATGHDAKPDARGAARRQRARTQARGIAPGPDARQPHAQPPHAHRPDARATEAAGADTAAHADTGPEARAPGDTPTHAPDDTTPRGEAKAPPTPLDMPRIGGIGATVEGDLVPRRKETGGAPPAPPGGGKGGGGGGGGGGARFHRRTTPESFERSLKEGVAAVRFNMAFVMVMTFAVNLLLLSIPVYLFQISDRVLTSRSLDTLVMLTVVIAGAVILQVTFDGVRRFMLMRTAVEVAARLGAPILSAAARASLHGSGKEFQTLGDLQQVRSFLTSGTLLSFLDVPFAPLFMLAIFLVHPHLGFIVVTTAVILMIIALINQRLTEAPFAEANLKQSRANLHLDSMTRNSQIINALAMIPEAVTIWGRETAASLTAQVQAQDRNVISAMVSKGTRLLTQIAMLGWGAYLAILGEVTGGMVIAASIIAGRALSPVEGAIEGWNGFLLSRAAYGRITNLLTRSGIRYERLRLPEPQGKLDVERLLYVPQGTKSVVLNAISFSLEPGETLAVIGNSGAGKTTLGKMLVGSILPTSGNVRLDLMDMRNWDPRQLGENIGYLPQDVQLFPGTIKDNIARMRPDATDEQIHRAAVLADVHDMIAQLPQGYETFVAPDGAPLSGGQKQRIALARAFFGEPRLLVLDEPNSNLDIAGDKALARAIRHARSNGITVVVITQKPALLSEVDKIMLLKEGGVAMFGPRAHVVKQLAKFRDGDPGRPERPDGKRSLPKEGGDT